MIEADFQDKLQTELRSRNCFVKPLVGNLMMSGMPDLFIINRRNAAFHVELKMWKNVRTMVPTDFLNLLEGPQRNVIPYEFWKRRVFCPMIAMSKLDENTCWLYDGAEHFWKTDFYNITLFIADIRNDYIYRRPV